MRTLPPLALSKSPLVLVLCQLRHAAIRDMGSYIPKIQDRLRRQGFPIDVSGEVREVAIRDGWPLMERHSHWEYRTRDERWSVIIREQAVVVQTTAYTGFDPFLDRLLLATDTVSEVVAELVVERVGLRYIDWIRPEKGESWKDYVKAGFHGIENRIVRPDQSVLFAQIISQTAERSRIIARVAQNRERMVLPVDLLAHPPALEVAVSDGEVVTLLDLDHFCEERIDYSREDLRNRAWKLHDGLDILFRDMVTPHALEVWR